MFLTTNIIVGIHVLYQFWLYQFKMAEDSETVSQKDNTSDARLVVDLA